MIDPTEVRRHILRMAHRSQTGHVGSCLSCVDILCNLYNHRMVHDPSRPNHSARDRLIVSKGHAAMAVYAVLAEAGYFPVSELEKYPEHPYEGHVNSAVPGVEWSTGSLGHGLAVGVGIALARPDVGGLPGGADASGAGFAGVAAVDPPSGHAADMVRG